MERGCSVPPGDGCAGSFPQPSSQKQQLPGSLSLLGCGASEIRNSGALPWPRCRPDSDLCLKIAPARSEQPPQMGRRLLLIAHPSFWHMPWCKSTRGRAKSGPGSYTKQSKACGFRRAAGDVVLVPVNNLMGKQIWLKNSSASMSIQSH